MQIARSRLSLLFVAYFGRLTPPWFCAANWNVCHARSHPSARRASRYMSSVWPRVETRA